LPDGLYTSYEYIGTARYSGSAYGPDSLDACNSYSSRQTNNGGPDSTYGFDACDGGNRYALNGYGAYGTSGLDAR
jgi:hypothetical protein